MHDTSHRLDLYLLVMTKLKIMATCSNINGLQLHGQLTSFGSFPAKQLIVQTLTINTNIRDNQYSKIF